MECVFVPFVDESCARYLKTVDSCSVVSDICEEMCVLVCFFLVPGFNVCHQRHREFKDVECFGVVVDDNNVWLVVSDAEVGRDCATTWRLHAWQVTVDYELAVHIAQRARLVRIWQDG